MVRDIQPRREPMAGTQGVIEPAEGRHRVLITRDLALELGQIGDAEFRCGDPANIPREPNGQGRPLRLEFGGGEVERPIADDRPSGAPPTWLRTSPSGALPKTSAAVSRWWRRW